MPETELTQASTSSPFIDGKAIGNMFSIAMTPESANYLIEQFRHEIKQRNVTGQYKPVLDELIKYVEIIKAQTPTNSSYWNGDLSQEIESKFRIYQASLAQDAIHDLMKELPGKVIHFDFAMNDQSELRQGFSMDKQALPPEIAEKLNRVYSNWLTQNNMICKEGVIYECDKEGVIKNENGIPVRVNPEQYCKLFFPEEDQLFNSKRERLLLENTGFSAFVREKNKNSFSVEVHRRNFPKPAPQPAEQSPS